MSYCGNHINLQLDSVKLGKGKHAQEARQQQRVRLLQRILYGASGVKGQFRDPAEVFSKGGE